MDVKNIVDNFRNKMNGSMSFAAQIYLSNCCSYCYNYHYFLYF